MKLKKTIAYFIIYILWVLLMSTFTALLLPTFMVNNYILFDFAILNNLLFLHYFKNIPDIMLWIDEYINHNLFEKTMFSGESSKVGYWLWEHTCYAFCMWVCDNFETFDNIEDNIPF